MEVSNDVEITKQLEKVFTIDGMGRPLKVKVLLELIKKYGVDRIIRLEEEISKRQYF